MLRKDMVSLAKQKKNVPDITKNEKRYSNFLNQTGLSEIVSYLPTDEREGGFTRQIAQELSAECISSAGYSRDGYDDATYKRFSPKMLDGCKKLLEHFSNEGISGNIVFNKNKNKSTLCFVPNSQKSVYITLLDTEYGNFEGDSQARGYKDVGSVYDRNKGVRDKFSNFGAGDEPQKIVDNFGKYNPINDELHDEFAKDADSNGFTLDDVIRHVDRVAFGKDSPIPVTVIIADSNGNVRPLYYNDEDNIEKIKKIDVPRENLSSFVSNPGKNIDSDGIKRLMYASVGDVDNVINTYDNYENDMGRNSVYNNGLKGIYQVTSHSIKHIDVKEENSKLVEQNDDIATSIKQKFSKKYRHPLHETMMRGTVVVPEEFIGPIIATGKSEMIDAALNYYISGNNRISSKDFIDSYDSGNTSGKNVTNADGKKFVPAFVSMVSDISYDEKFVKTRQFGSSEKDAEEARNYLHDTYSASIKKFEMLFAKDSMDRLIKDYSNDLSEDKSFEASDDRGELIRDAHKDYFKAMSKFMESNPAPDRNDYLTDDEFEAVKNESDLAYNEESEKVFGEIINASFGRGEIVENGKRICEINPKAVAAFAGGRGVYTTELEIQSAVKSQMRAVSKYGVRQSDPETGNEYVTLVNHIGNQEPYPEEFRFIAADEDDMNQVRDIQYFESNTVSFDGKNLHEKIPFGHENLGESGLAMHAGETEDDYKKRMSEAGVNEFWTNKGLVINQSLRANGVNASCILIDNQGVAQYEGEAQVSEHANSYDSKSVNYKTVNVSGEIGQIFEPDDRQIVEINGKLGPNPEYGAIHMKTKGSDGKLVFPGYTGTITPLRNAYEIKLMQKEYLKQKAINPNTPLPSDLELVELYPDKAFDDAEQVYIPRGMGNTIQRTKVKSIVDVQDETIRQQINLALTSGDTFSDSAGSLNACYRAVAGETHSIDYINNLLKKGMNIHDISAIAESERNKIVYDSDSVKSANMLGTDNARNEIHNEVTKNADEPLPYVESCYVNRRFNAKYKDECFTRQEHLMDIDSESGIVVDGRKITHGKIYTGYNKAVSDDYLLRCMLKGKNINEYEDIEAADDVLGTVTYSDYFDVNPMPHTSNPASFELVSKSDMNEKDSAGYTSSVNTATAKSTGNQLYIAVNTDGQSMLTKSGYIVRQYDENGMPVTYCPCEVTTMKNVMEKDRDSADRGNMVLSNERRAQSVDYGEPMDSYVAISYDAKNGKFVTTPAKFKNVKSVSEYMTDYIDARIRQDMKNLVDSGQCSNEEDALNKISTTPGSMDKYRMDYLKRADIDRNFMYEFMDIQEKLGDKKLTHEDKASLKISNPDYDSSDENSSKTLKLFEEKSGKYVVNKDVINRLNIASQNVARTICGVNVAQQNFGGYTQDDAYVRFAVSHDEAEAKRTKNIKNASEHADFEINNKGETIIKNEAVDDMISVMKQEGIRAVKGVSSRDAAMTVYREYSSVTNLGDMYYDELNKENLGVDRQPEKLFGEDLRKLQIISRSKFTLAGQAVTKNGIGRVSDRTLYTDRNDEYCQKIADGCYDENAHKFDTNMRNKRIDMLFSKRDNSDYNPTDEELQSVKLDRTKFDELASKMTIEDLNAKRAANISLYKDRTVFLVKAAEGGFSDDEISQKCAELNISEEKYNNIMSSGVLRPEALDEAVKIERERHNNKINMLLSGEKFTDEDLTNAGFRSREQFEKASQIVTPDELESRRSKSRENFNKRVEMLAKTSLSKDGKSKKPEYTDEDLINAGFKDREQFDKLAGNINRENIAEKQAENLDYMCRKYGVISDRVPSVTTHVKKINHGAEFERAINVGDKALKSDGNKGVLGAVVDMEMIPDDAADSHYRQVLENRRALLGDKAADELELNSMNQSRLAKFSKENPDVREGGSALTASSRMNASAAYQACQYSRYIEAAGKDTSVKNDDKITESGQARQVNIHTNMMVDSKSKDVNEDSSEDGRGLSMQLVMALAAKGGKNLIHEFYSPNTEALKVQREAMISLGCDITPEGKLTIGYTSHSVTNEDGEIIFEQRKSMQPFLPESMTKDTKIARQVAMFDAITTGSSYDKKLHENIEDFANGQKTEKLPLQYDGVVNKADKNGPCIETYDVAFKSYNTNKQYEQTYKKKDFSSGGFSVNKVNVPLVVNDAGEYQVDTHKDNKGNSRLSERKNNRFLENLPDEGGFLKLAVPVLMRTGLELKNVGTEENPAYHLPVMSSVMRQGRDSLGDAGFVAHDYTKRYENIWNLNNAYIAQRADKEFLESVRDLRTMHRAFNGAGNISECDNLIKSYAKAAGIDEDKMQDWTAKKLEEIQESAFSAKSGNKYKIDITSTSLSSADEYIDNTIQRDIDIMNNYKTSIQSEYTTITADVCDRIFEGKDNNGKNMMKATMTTSSTKVISPDPSLELDEIVINEDTAESLGLKMQALTQDENDADLWILREKDKDGSEMISRFKAVMEKDENGNDVKSRFKYQQVDETGKAVNDMVLTLGKEVSYIDKDGNEKTKDVMNMEVWKAPDGTYHDHARVLVGRDPMLSEGGIRYMRARIAPKSEDSRIATKGLKVHPSAMKSFEGDFDGDTTYLIPVRGEKAYNEAMAKYTFEAELVNREVAPDKDAGFPLNFNTGLDVASGLYADNEIKKQKMANGEEYKSAKDMLDEVRSEVKRRDDAGLKTNELGNYDADGNITVDYKAFNEMHELVEKSSKALSQAYEAGFGSDSVSFANDEKHLESLFNQVFDSEGKKREKYFCPKAKDVMAFGMYVGNFGHTMAEFKTVDANGEEKTRVELIREGAEYICKDKDGKLITHIVNNKEDAKTGFQYDKCPEFISNGPKENKLAKNDCWVVSADEKTASFQAVAAKAELTGIAGSAAFKASRVTFGTNEHTEKMIKENPELYPSLLKKYPNGKTAYDVYKERGSYEAAATALTHPVSQSVMQLKHDTAPEIRRKVDVIKNNLPNIWNGTPMVGKFGNGEKVNAEDLAAEYNRIYTKCKSDYIKQARNEFREYSDDEGAFIQTDENGNRTELKATDIYNMYFKIKNEDKDRSQEEVDNIFKERTKNIESHVHTDDKGNKTIVSPKDVVDHYDDLLRKNINTSYDKTNEEFNKYAKNIVSWSIDTKRQGTNKKTDMGMDPKHFKAMFQAFYSSKGGLNVDNPNQECVELMTAAMTVTEKTKYGEEYTCIRGLNVMSPKEDSPLLNLATLNPNAEKWIELAEEGRNVYGLDIEDGNGNIMASLAPTGVVENFKAGEAARNSGSRKKQPAYVSFTASDKKDNVYSVNTYIKENTGENVNVTEVSGKDLQKFKKLNEANASQNSRRRSLTDMQSEVKDKEEKMLKEINEKSPSYVKNINLYNATLDKQNEPLHIDPVKKREETAKDMIQSKINEYNVDLNHQPISEKLISRAFRVYEDDKMINMTNKIPVELFEKRYTEAETTRCKNAGFEPQDEKYQSIIKQQAELNAEFLKNCRDDVPGYRDAYMIARDVTEKTKLNSNILGDICKDIDYNPERTVGQPFMSEHDIPPVPPMSEELGSDAYSDMYVPDENIVYDNTMYPDDMFDAPVSDNNVSEILKQKLTNNILSQTNNVSVTRETMNIAINTCESDMMMGINKETPSENLKGLYIQAEYEKRGLGNVPNLPTEIVADIEKDADNSVNFRNAYNKGESDKRIAYESIVDVIRETNADINDVYNAHRNIDYSEFEISKISRQNNTPPVQPAVNNQVQPNNTPPVQPNNTPPVQPNNTPPVQPNNTPPVQPAVNNQAQPNNTPPVQPAVNNQAQPNNTPPVQPAVSDSTPDLTEQLRKIAELQAEQERMKAELMKKDKELSELREKEKVVEKTASFGSNKISKLNSIYMDDDDTSSQFGLTDEEIFDM